MIIIIKRVVHNIITQYFNKKLKKPLLFVVKEFLNARRVFDVEMRISAKQASKNGP